MRAESEYHRFGTLAYLAAYDVHRARVQGRCEPSTGIKPFTALVDQVMSTEPYASARRVFWVVDNWDSHRQAIRLGVHPHRPQPAPGPPQAARPSRATSLAA